VNLIRATAQVQRAKLHRRLKEERQAAVRGERQKGKDKAAALQDLKETLLRIIQRSGLSPTMQNKFKADLVTASTPAAIGRAFKKIELLAAKERFKDAVKKFTAMETSAKRAGRKVLSNDDRTQIGQWIQQAESAIFAPITAETAQRGGRGALTGVSRRPRSFLTAAQYDNATSSAAVTTELIAELVNERRAEKNRAAVGEKTTRAENVKQIQTNLGYDEESDTYAKELTVSRHMQEHNDREASFRGLRAEAYEDTESTTRRAEGWQREENLGVLTRLISRRMKEQEEEYNSELRDENQVVEQFLKEAGFKNLSHAYMQLMGTFGRSQTRMETVTLGGVDTSITLDEVLEFLALDPQTLAKIAKGRLLKVKSMTQRLAKAVTIEEIEEIRAKFEPQYGALVQAMKARIQNNLQPRLFAVIMRLKGAEPEFVPEYWPTIVDRAATEAAGLAQAYREGGTFGVILSMYQENLGLTLARDENATAPFVINGLLSRYIQHTDSALKIIHMAEATREASATLLSPKVADAINRTSGKKVYNNLKTMLAEASLAGRDTIPGGTDRLQVANAGVAATLILTNPGTYIRQLGGIPLLWSEMPHKYFMKGIARLRPGTFKEMQRWSGFFWARYSGDSMSRYSPVAGSTIDGFDNIAMTQALKALMKTGWSRDWKGFGMSWNRALRTIKLLDWFDSIAARIAWEGYKAQAEDLHPEFTFQQKMRWVSNRASMAARSSQNTSSPLDAGGVVMNTRDSFWRYFFLFTTQPMKSLNQLKLAWHDSPRQGFVASAGVFSNWIWSAYATNLILEGGSEILGTLIANAFGDDPDEDLRQERMMRMFMKMNFRMVQDVLGTVPVAGDAFAHMIEAISQRTRSGGALDAVVFENINDTVDDFTRNVRKAINALIEDGAEEEFYWAVYKANKALVTGAFDLVGNPLHMPYYRARRILEPVQGALPEPANIFFGFEEP